MFGYEAGEIINDDYRNPRKTNWELYYSKLLAESNILDELSTIQQLERAAQMVTNNIQQAFEASCPLIKKSSNRDVSWWNKKLGNLRKKARRLFNRAKLTSNWDEYRSALTEYNREIRRSKRRDWRHTCESIEQAPMVARLQKVLSKDHTNGLGNIKQENGNFTFDAKETLEVMMKTHFPCSIPLVAGNELNPTGTFYGSKSRETIEEAGKVASIIFTQSKVEWAVNSFQPFKSPGKDGIYPALLQKSKGLLTTSLTDMFKASLTLGYIPTAWREVRVVFIPKANKKDKTSPKSFRPISLSSIMLKIMEKVIDDFIKSQYLKVYPLNKYQFAYQTGKSTITALHTLVTKIEKSMEAKEISLAAFLDIEGAFDNASHNSMKEAMLKRGFDMCVVDWIDAMLANRKISADLGISSVTVIPTRGCPQGGVLSPLLWSLIVDELLANLVTLGFEIIGFADDLVILVRGKYDHIISNRMQIALNYTLSWCKMEGLNINPSKTTIIPFTRKRRITITNLQLEDTLIELSSEVKYLGVTLDSKLNWNSHLEQIINKATNALWISKRTFGKKWGLKPRMIHWIYSAIVRPRITYASLVWWPTTKKTAAQKKLVKLQRIATLAITGAMRSTPSKALDAILNILPLHQYVQLEAEKSALRLQRYKKFLEGDLKGHLSILKDFQINPIVVMNQDWMERTFNLDPKYKVMEPSRDIWESGGPNTRSGSIIFYTDGSKMGNKTGAGVTGPGTNISISMGYWPTVFQAEIQAILECTSVCLKRNYRHSNICMFSDSQAALKALHSFTCESKLVWECILSLNQLAANNQVNLYWVPGHRGIEGNEKADTLARLGSTNQFIGPEPFCGISSCAIRMELKNYEQKMVESNWNNTLTARQSKRFIKPNSSNTQTILSLSKKDLSTYTGLITGHCPCKYHLRKLGMLPNDNCRFCNIECETTEHLLCKCTALFNSRRRILDKGLLEPFEIWSAHPNKVVGFLRCAVPNWEDAYNQTAIITALNSGQSP